MCSSKLSYLAQQINILKMPVSASTYSNIDKCGVGRYTYRHNNIAYTVVAAFVKHMVLTQDLYKTNILRIHSKT